MFFIFFFSSRRRHTRYIGDWSSDVCSSDLVFEGDAVIRLRAKFFERGCGPDSCRTREHGKSDRVEKIHDTFFRARQRADSTSVCEEKSKGSCPRLPRQLGARPQCPYYRPALCFRANTDGLRSASPLTKIGVSP